MQCEMLAHTDLIDWKNEPGKDQNPLKWIILKQIVLQVKSPGFEFWFWKIDPLAAVLKTTLSV